jgi:small multidrug resistance pump
LQYIYLTIAIIAEVIGTSLLKFTEGFSKSGPTALVLISYALAFWMLSLTLKTMSVAIVYAIWSGAGIFLIAMIGWIFMKQQLDFAAILGIFLICAGVVVIQLFSNSIKH